jgi:predicted nucleotidyltransferase
MLKTTNSDLKSLVHQKRDEIISIATKHGVENIHLLEIQNNFSINPEIDFLIDYTLEQLSPWFPSGLKQELETLLNTKVGIITTNSLKDNNQEIFLQQGIPL